MNKISAGNAMPVTAAVARPSTSGKPLPSAQKQRSKGNSQNAQNVRINNKRRPKSAARKAVAAQASATGGAHDVSSPKPGDPTFKPNPQDMKTLNQIVAIGKWDEVEKTVKAMSERGELTEGLLEAAVHLITVCQNMGEASQVTQTLEKVANLIAFCLQSGYMPPNVKLMDKLMTMDPVSQEAAIKETMLEAFNNGGVDKSEFVAELEGMVEQMDEQNSAMQAELDSAAAAGLQTANMIEMVKTRKSAVERMQFLLKLAN
mmetsp:Transcript_31824/g.69517  ORF Transcript_31824/g.69517 Transcript_31824/m.69517 type:complete len:260 (-) Transcript_31824:692-1471(-)|eukprot:CAMPEP_0118935366 /NCGR_PEP_ID=MMETSP1169-20130426/15533_1 /TAXON_ID=36882 /ORGANISM="Pyramimonas obovata, Strain CCMP722" /LENGTH=259 /DNA_ID=CAMNT_0006878389 /DNA_START=55 /DNA_END=834 /DNA_ORIENTATION=-